jgi:diguanylate cyclase (GGDEF)-like protein/PAS domain S-box-containing protein
VLGPSALAASNMSARTHVEPLSVEWTSNREIERGFQRHRKALAELLHADSLKQGDLGRAFELCTELATQILKVERASVWQFGADHRSIVCADLFERTPWRHSRGMELPAAAYPSYFAALSEERTIAADDALADARTREFTDSYLVPNAISAMLDAPVFVRGQMVGVVCHEHVGDRHRRWLPWEELVAGSLADFVALALESAEHHRDQQRLELQQRALEARLRSSEESLRTLFGVSPVGMVLGRLADERMITGNQRATEMFEIPAAEVAGRPVAELYADQEERARLLGLVRAQTYVEGFEAKMKTAKGRVFPALLSAQLLVFGGEPTLLVSVTDVTQQKATEARLRELATHDPLTGCLNRREFFELAVGELERALRYGRPVSMAMLDADHFKQLNDQFGHAIGDRALQAIAESCRRTLRQSDLLGRLGGEEFAALFVETPLGDARCVTERLLRDVALARVPAGDHEVSFTLSAGVVERHEHEPLEAMLKRADEALYRAKKAGRNRLEIGA